MTGLQKLEAEEKRQEIFKKYDYLCSFCGKPVNIYGTSQLAHGIAKSKVNIKKYGEKVINHELNLFPVCSLYCNSRKNIGMNPEKTKELVLSITNAGF